MNAGQIIGTMNGPQVVGLDIAKLVFQLHTVDMSTGEIVNMQIKRNSSVTTVLDGVDDQMLMPSKRS
jgi:hypothetical protein